jgi:phosphohistidine phosphatase
MDAGLTLWVLRHAKAAENGPDGDTSRPITGKGKRQSKVVRDHVAGSDDESLPDLVLCSPAVRARETAEIVLTAMPDARIEFDKALYSRDADGVADWLKELDPVDRHLMIVGHNPTFHELCVMLASSPDSETLDTEGLPTATLVKLDFPDTSSWSRLSEHTAKCAERFVPKV